LRRFCNILSAPFLLMLAFGALPQGTQAQTALQDRITQPVESANAVPITGSVHPLAKQEFDAGLTDNSKVLQDITINFKRSAAQEASLQALLAAQQNPSSPSYHKWLTPVQFGQQFGMSAGDLAQVSSWLQQEGFTVTSVAQSGNAISFSGSVASAERAFQTQIHNYTVNGESHYANATPISVPAALGGLVNSVHGLDNFRLKSRLLKKAKFTSGISGGHYVAPGDLAVIYDINPLFTAGFTGKGITIAVVGQTDIVPADITDFRAAAGLSVNNPTVFTVPGTTPESVTAGATSGDLYETDTDLEYAGGVATGATLYLVNSDDVDTSLAYAVQNTINGITIPIISQSYGGCEAAQPTAHLTAEEAVLAQANSQGQTIILAAGDDGAADCDEGTESSPDVSAVYGLAVDYPGSSVYVTDAGGSEFTGDGTPAAPQTGSGTYWSANGSNDVLTSAKSYIPEMAWNDTLYDISQGGFSFSAGGGGVSQLWTKPSWQTGVPNIPADGHRDVPDIALDASLDHDGYLLCTQVTTVASPGAYVSSCQANSFRLSDPGQSDNDDLTTVGGTSVAAPIFNGLLAIVEQKLGITGGLGNVNPTLYSLAANATTYASAFHDITVGNNQVPCTSGSPDCPTGSNPVIGYAAGTGYDQATGIGSVDANNLATAWAALVTATGTKTTLTAAPGTSLEINEAVTFTATVAPNTLSTAPTGTVTFTVDGVAKTPVTLSTASPYTAALKTDFATAGTHTVLATYSSGDATYTGSTSNTVVITVVASGTAATTTAVTASPTTFALGAAVTLTATISGTTAGTLTGPVTFTTGGVTIGKVSQVTLGSGNTATAVFNVSAATTSLGFAAGTDTITATYGGDTFNAASSGTTTVTVTNPSITVTATNMTISSPSPGNTGTSTITITSTGGYAGTVNLTGEVPSTVNVDGAFNSSSIPLAAGATATTTLTITTVTAGGNLRKGTGGNVRKSTAQIAVAGGTALGCLLLLLIPGIRRKRWPAALVMLVFLSIGAGLGCGGGSGGGTPAGTYTITVVAADSSNANITGSTTFTLTIN
jgi:Pro-kumamolisin, activation domain/Bacterial Ig-like domain (group 3)